MGDIQKLEVSIMPELTDKIIEMCTNIGLGRPEYVAYQPIEIKEFKMCIDALDNTKKFSLPLCYNDLKEPPKIGECDKSIALKQIYSGGSAVYGWKISRYSNLIIEFMPYKMWKDVDGNVYDVTPDTYIGKQSLFVEDSDLNSLNISPKWFPLTDSKYAKEIIKLSEKTITYVEKREHPELMTREEIRRLSLLKKRKDEIISIVSRKVGRNSKCPCESGIKYKNCCGRF
jgi:hypothetical protein